MARVNVSMPDDLYSAARASCLNISQLSQQAVRAELARRSKVTKLDAYLEQLEDELGPVPDEERAAARRWADEVVGPTARQHPA